MQNFYRKGRRDLNEKDIREYLAGRSIPYLVLSPGQGADLLIFIDGDAVLVEVKNPLSSHSRRKLTETEAKFKGYCDLHGVSYVVVFSVQEMEDVIDRVSAANKLLAAASMGGGRTVFSGLSFTLLASVQ